MSNLTFQSSWNPKRQETTYRIGKQGTSVFLLFGIDAIADLHREITRALEGNGSDRLST